MGEDADFSGYLAARWPSLVRTLVLLGCPEELARDVAVTALARCRRDWARTRLSEDVDVVVHRALLDAWDERRRTPWWREVPATSVGFPPELVGALDRLSPAARVLLVLQRHADLEPAQAAAVVGPVNGPVNGVPLPLAPTTTELRAAGDGLVVLAPPTDEELALRRRPRRAGPRPRVVLAVGVPLLLLGAGLAWWATSDEPETELSLVAAQRARNPAEVAWYANGELHLDHVVLELPGLRDFAAMGSGAVYGDSEGRVVSVTDQGEREVLGTKDPDVPLAASDEQGWVAWVDPTGAAPKLMVHELGSRTVIGELELSEKDAEAARPIAVDDDTVYVADASGAHSWRPLAVPRPQEKLTTSLPLRDISSRTRVYQLDPETIRVVQPYFSVAFEFTGTSPQLSADGDFVLGRNPGHPDIGPMLIYDTRSGEALPSGLTIDDVALAAALGPEETVTYIIARAEDRPEAGAFLSSSFSGQLELRTCELDTGECEALARFPSTGSRPLLGG